MIWGSREDLSSDDRVQEGMTAANSQVFQHQKNQASTYIALGFIVPFLLISYLNLKI